MRCQWELSSSDPSARLSLQFSSFATEMGYDFVHVYDGLTLERELRSASGASSAAVTSSGGSMTVVFSSDSSIQMDGFVATVTTVQ